jgi:hypothetical protein
MSVAVDANGFAFAASKLIASVPPTPSATNNVDTLLVGAVIAIPNGVAELNDADTTLDDGIPVVGLICSASSSVEFLFAITSHELVESIASACGWLGPKYTTVLLFPSVSAPPVPIVYRNTPVVVPTYTNPLFGATTTLVGTAGNAIGDPLIAVSTPAVIVYSLSVPPVAPVDIFATYT